MNPIIPFHFADREIRVVQDTNGDPLFVGRDICGALGYSDATTAMRSHCRGVQKLHPIADALGRIQDARVLAEPDVLRLIVNCSLPAAQAFERLVFEEILPTIRKTGKYSVAPAQTNPYANLPAEQQALISVMLDNASIKAVQAEQGAAILAISQRVEEAANTQLLMERPTAAESIVHIRERINKLYGLPARIVDQVIRQSPYSPKPAGMVRNQREEAQGSSYAVYWIKDVSAVFARFVRECVPQTATKATHPLFDGRFKLITARSTHA